MQHDVEGAVGQRVEPAGRALHALVGLAARRPRRAGARDRCRRRRGARPAWAADGGRDASRSRPRARRRRRGRGGGRAARARAACRARTARRASPGRSSGRAGSRACRSRSSPAEPRLTARAAPPRPSREPLRDGEARARRARAASARRALGARATRAHERLFALTGATPQSRIVDIGCGVLGLRRHAPTTTSPGSTASRGRSTPGRSSSPTSSRACRSPTASSTSRTARASSSTSRPPTAPRSPPSCAASRAAGTSRRRRSPFPSSRTRCCRSRTGCRPGCGASTGGSAWRASGSRSSCCGAPRWRELFGEPVAERAGPLVKSWISVRPL